MSKYGAIKTIVNDIKFASRMEAEFYKKLLLDLENGVIESIELQPRYELQPPYKKNGKSIRKIEYIADFRVVYSDGREKIYDVKGFSRDSTFKLKRKIFDFVYPDKELVLITHYRGNWITVEEKENILKNNKKKLS